MPAPNPRNQAEAITYAHRKEREKFREFLVAETELIEILSWAELPTTKKVVKAFTQFEERIWKKLKACQWTEAEGKGLVFLLNYAGLLQETIGDCKKTYQNLQVKKQKEG